MLTKKLTPAQLRKMEQLINQRNVAQGQLDGFVQYLREEHDAPEGEYALFNINDGFVVTKQDSSKAAD